MIYENFRAYIMNTKQAQNALLTVKLLLKSHIKKYGHTPVGNEVIVLRPADLEEMRGQVGALLTLGINLKNVHFVSLKIEAMTHIVTAPQLYIENTRKPMPQVQKLPLAFENYHYFFNAAECLRDFKQVIDKKQLTKAFEQLHIHNTLVETDEDDSLQSSVTADLTNSLSSSDTLVPSHVSKVMDRVRTIIQQKPLQLRKTSTFASIPSDIDDEYEDDEDKDKINANDKIIEQIAQQIEREILISRRAVNDNQHIMEKNDVFESLCKSTRLFSNNDNRTQFLQNIGNYLKSRQISGVPIDHLSKARLYDVAQYVITHESKQLRYMSTVEKNLWENERVKNEFTANQVLRIESPNKRMLQDVALRERNEEKNPVITQIIDELNALALDAFNIQELGKKWPTILIGENITQWTQALKDHLLLIDADSAHYMSQEVASLSSYVKMGQLRFKRAAETLEKTRAALDQIPAEQRTAQYIQCEQIFSTVKKQWDTNHTIWESISDKSDDKNNPGTFTQWLKKLSDAIHTYKAPSTISNATSNATPTVETSKLQSQRMEGAQKAAGLMAALKGKNIRRIETNVPQFDIISSTFMTEVINNIPALSQHTQIQLTRYRSRDIALAKVANNSVSISRLGNANNVATALPEVQEITLSGSYVKEQQPRSVFLCSDLSTNDTLKMGCGFFIENTDTPAAKKARALGVLDMLSQLLIQTNDSDSDKITIEMTNALNAQYITGALLSLGVSAQSIEKRTTGWVSKKTLSDSEIQQQFLNDLGTASEAQTIINKVQEYIESHRNLTSTNHASLLKQHH